MKLKIIEKTSSRSFEPKAGFSKSGYFSLNKSAQEKYNIQEGQKIMIVQDEDKTTDFYLICTEREGFPKLRFMNASTTLVAGYSDAMRAILNQYGLPKQRFQVRLGGQIKTELGHAICLITAHLKEVNNA